MENEFKIKEKLLDKIIKILDDRIVEANEAIESAKESRNTESKCTVGDKYETGRAMMQFEMEKNIVQLNKTIHLKNDLLQIDLFKTYKNVEFGSLVITGNGNYFISIAFGKIVIDEIEFFCLSLASPIGKLLHKKTTGNKIIFQQKEITIEKII